TPSPPLSKFSASIVPGIAAGVPVYGESPEPPVDPPADATVIAPRLKPALSTRTVRTCWPAVRVTGSVTVVHACQLPVAGMAMDDHTPLPLKPTCSAPPPLGEAGGRRAAPGGGGGANWARMAAAGREVARVIEPLAGRDPPDVVTAVGARLDVDAGRSIDTAGISRRRVVIRDAFSSVVKVHRL